MPRFEEPPLRPPTRDVPPTAIAAVVALVLVVWLWFEVRGRPPERPPVPAMAAPAPPTVPVPAPVPMRPAPPAVPVPPPPQAAQPAPAAAPPAPWVSIYLCKSFQGAMFWANTPCAEHRATLDRIHRVPGSLPWDQQVAIAQAEAQEAARLYAPPAAPVMRAAPAPNAGQPSRAAECAMLDQAIQQYDAITRQPQSPPVLDQIRAQRRQAMDRKFALRC